MEQISLCEPNNKIYKHMNVDFGKLNDKNAGRFVGMYTPNGQYLYCVFEVWDFIINHSSKIVLGSKYKSPNNFDLIAPTDECFYEIKNSRFGKIPFAKGVKEGDYITLKCPSSDEKIKVVVTADFFRYFSTHDIKPTFYSKHWLGVALVMQREELNGKYQYFV